MFFLLPKSIYPIKTIEYSQTNFDESYWKMSSTLKNNNGLTKLPHDFLSINKYFHNEITTDQQKELLKNGFTQMPGKYYQSFSSYYYDLLKSKIPVYITSDSVMNYSYNMLSSLRKEVVEKELIPKYIQWLDNGINYFTALKNDKKGNISELCDTNIAIFKESKKRLSDKPSFDTYIQSYSYLTQQYAKEEKPDSTILILLYNKRADTKSLFSKILTINSMFGISTDDLRLKVLDQDISSLVKRYKNVEEILRLETSRETFVQDEAIDGTSFYDSVFSNVENNWGDNENYTYRKDIVGDIYTVNVDDERWKGVKDITSTIAVEGDQSTYRLIIKYFSYVEDLLNKQGLLNDNSKGIIKTTIEDVSFMHNCSSVDCLKNNPEVLFDFFKNTGSINNLSDNSSLLVTEGIFSENNQLYVGPIYKSVGMNIDVIKGEVLGVSLFGN
ncbi:MAG TPA: DUF3160 domain-containing protein, partial [Candidatus Dojkabacteria bacterium]|nr:DUF3160 domain-containing protein [Candidatus Dojkabacteria bacterium]